MGFAVTRMSSKGQIVIPKNLRDGINNGENLLVFRDDDRLVLMKERHASKKLKEDIKFSKRIEEAYRSIERGEGITMDAEEFLRRLDIWSKSSSPSSLMTEPERSNMKQSRRKLKNKSKK